MSVSLKDNKSIAPFMGEPKLPSLGLNPLGIRTASEQLFTTLLPGLNVVTLRIRYYSFYCWLLKTFYSKRDTANVNDFKRHIRLSELLMALIHANSPSSMGIPGNTRAFEILRRKGDSWNFLDDAMPNGKDSGGYWKRPYGAFGSYYAASMREMGLISPIVTKKDLLYNITPKTDDYISGDMLADVFEESIGRKLSLLFQNCAKAGHVTRSQLEELESGFQTHSMPRNHECLTLENMLLQFDNPRSDSETYRRKDTLRLLLLYIEKSNLDDFSELDFAKFVYTLFKSGKSTDVTTFGWYDYYLNDNRQYEALNLFDELLIKLINSDKPGKWENIKHFAETIANDISTELADPDVTLSELFLRWDKIVIPKDRMAKAFYQFFDDYINNAEYEHLKKELKTKFRSVHNDAIDFFDSIKSHSNNTLFEYVKYYITEHIIYGHYAESMRKFSQNGVATQKLMIENGYVKGLDRYNSSHSSPRIETLFYFATDLGLISNFKLSPYGKALLNDLSK